MIKRGGTWSVFAAGLWLVAGNGGLAQAQGAGPEGEPVEAQEPMGEPIEAQEPAYDEPEPMHDQGYPPQGQPEQGWGEPAPQRQPAGRVDGPRFRGGVAFTGGAEFVSNADFSATMFGIDGRLGVQVNHLLGLYVAPHLSFGSAGGVEGSTGTFATILMADLTFLDALFVGAGFGYGIMNNPSGPALGFRVGGYPVKSAPDHRARRRGLVVSLEARTYFLGDPFGTGVQIMGAIGYEAF
jgi:hypothetical protein